MTRIKRLLCAAILLPAAMGATLPHAGIPSARAGTFDAREAPQGSTVEILIPKEDITQIKAMFDGSPVYFYPVSKEPAFDEPISRAEFLELMFLNSDLEEPAAAPETVPAPETIADPDTAALPDFPDVPPTHPYYETIRRAAALDIIHGYEDGLFRPYTTITRGQIAKILVNAFDPAPVLTRAPRFPDVPLGHVFYEHIDRAIKAQIFQGYPDGLMRPNRAINFSEAEIVIRRAAAESVTASVSAPAPFTPLGPRDYYRGYAGIHRSSEIKTKDLQLLLFRDPAHNPAPADGTSANSEPQTIHLNVVPRTFPTVSFNLSADKTALFGKDDQDKTWAAVDGAKANPTDQQLWEGPFIMPTEGELTLGFGDKLYINGVYSGSHFGLDLANDEGTPVHASNHGKVTLSAWTPSFGNTVVIDHGHNIYTMYLHLSELRAQQGQMVQKGDLIGLMGATGIATGSHLHFTHFVGGIIVDSGPWMEGEGM